MSEGNKLHKFAMALSMISQLGLSVIVPILLCIFAARWVQRTFSLGSWVVLIGILLGVGSGFCSFVKFIKAAVKQDDEDEK